MFSVIITDYKTIKLTISCIERFIDNCNANLDFIIVDNSTCNEGLLYLQCEKIKYEKLPINSESIYQFKIKGENVLIVESKCNGGYAKGNNLGAKISDIVFNNENYIFSNNDISFIQSLEPGIFEEIFIKYEIIGIIGPDVIKPDGEKQNPRKEMSFSSQMILKYFDNLWLRCRFKDKLWNRDSDNYHEKITSWVSGSFMIVRGKAFKEVEGFDENTFLYAEEMILSERMRRKGYQTLYYPQISIIHEHRGATSDFKQRRINHISCLYYYTKYKNIGIIKKFISNISFFLAEGVYFFLHKGNQFLNKLLRKK